MDYYNTLEDKSKTITQQYFFEDTSDDDGE